MTEIIMSTIICVFKSFFGCNEVLSFIWKVFDYKNYEIYCKKIKMINS